MRCSAFQPGGSPCKYPAKVGDLCGVHHRQQQRKESAVPDPTLTPFEIHPIEGEPPPPGSRWLADLKPKWAVYAFIVTQNPGTWHAIETEDAVWAHKGSGVLRGMGYEAVARGSTIYARTKPAAKPGVTITFSGDNWNPGPVSPSHTRSNP